MTEYTHESAAADQNALGGGSASASTSDRRQRASSHPGRCGAHEPDAGRADRLGAPIGTPPRRLGSRPLATTVPGRAASARAGSRKPAR